MFCFISDLSHSETRLSVYLDNCELHVYNRTAVYSNLEKLFGLDQLLPRPSETAQELVTYVLSSCLVYMSLVCQLCYSVHNFGDKEICGNCTVY